MTDAEIERLGGRKTAKFQTVAVPTMREYLIAKRRSVALELAELDRILGYRKRNKGEKKA